MLKNSTSLLVSMLPKTCTMAILANLKYSRKEQEIILLVTRVHKSCVRGFKFANLATVP
jgi:hypothetical protein